MNNITKQVHGLARFVKASSSVQHLYHKIDSTVENDARVFPQSSARSSDCGYFFSLPDQLNAYPADKNVFAPLHKKRSHKKGFCQLSSQIAGQPFAFRLHISGYILCCKSSKGSQWQKFINSVLPCRIPTGKIQPARNK